MMEVGFTEKNARHFWPIALQAKSLDAIYLASKNYTSWSVLEMAVIEDFEIKVSKYVF